MLKPGEKTTISELAAELQRAGYSEKDNKAPMGSFRAHGGTLEVMPGPESYHSEESATITVSGGKVSAITSRSAGDLAAYELEPQLVTSLFDAEQRSKRQLVKYEGPPKGLVRTVPAIGCPRFFQPSGVNFIRLAEAAGIDFTHQRHQQ